MVSRSILVLVSAMIAVMAEALSTTLMEDVNRADQAMRPKAKRAQELLMFGNQQNRQPENLQAAANLYSPTAEKRTLGSSGLEDLKAAFPPTEKFNRGKPLGNSMHELFDGKSLSPYEKSYQYGKVLDNQLGEIIPRTWDVPSYPRYYSMSDDRRKRSDNSPMSTNAPVATTISPAPPVSRVPQQPVVPVKRSLPIYQEPRYKRELDLDPEAVLTLLSLLEAERRNRNWSGYDNDEYDNVEDEGNMVDADEEDPRSGGAWLEGPVYPPHHFTVGTESLSPSDIGIPRTHPASYYEQYGNQYGQQYGGNQYGGAQYGATYPQQGYYPEKRFMVSRKRSQGYGTYGGRNDMVSLAQLLGSQPRGYPSYQHRLVF